MRRFAALLLLAIACHRSPTEPEPPSISATLAGRVYLVEGGSAVLDARVVATGATRQETATDATGSFRFDSLTPGTYSVAVSPIDANTRGIVLPVIVRSGANWLDVPVSNSGCVIYYGSVHDAATGQPIAGAKVDLINQTVTNASGEYALVVGCPPHFIGSSVGITFQHPDYKPYQLLLIMAPRESFAVRDVLMERR
jgi:carboxypeptidase family protein